jgi:hypothetical protein
MRTASGLAPTPTTRTARKNRDGRSSDNADEQLYAHFDARLSRDGGAASAKIRSANVRYGSIATLAVSGWRGRKAPHSGHDDRRSAR